MDGCSVTRVAGRMKKNGTRVGRPGSLAIRGLKEALSARIANFGCGIAGPSGTGTSSKPGVGIRLRFLGERVGSRARDSGQTDPESHAIGLGNNFKDCSSLDGAARLGRAP
jgi:hypothetical protein